LITRFDDDLKKAMKASERAKISVLRMVKAAVKNRQIEKGGDLTDDEIIAVLSSMVKQRRESVEQFTKAGRMDLVHGEDQEIAIIQTYLPEQLKSDDLDRIILEAINEASARTAQDMGKVMRVLMPRVRGVADGKYVNQRVKELLEARVASAHNEA